MFDLRLDHVTLITPQEIKENQTLYVQGGRMAVSQVHDAPAAHVLDAQGAYALPGLIDLHIHGFAGHGPELGSVEELWEMSRALVKYGVTAFCHSCGCLCILLC